MDTHRVAEIAARHGLRLVVQFGSSVTNKMHAKSDIDIGVLFGRREVSWEQLSDITRELQALEPQREIDVAVMDHADPLFLKKIADNAILLYGSQSEFHELKIYAFRRFVDHRKYLDMEREFVRRNVGSQ